MDAHGIFGESPANVFAFVTCGALRFGECMCVCVGRAWVCVVECDSGLACVNISATLCRTQPVVATRSTQLISVSQRQLKCPRWTREARRGKAAARWRG